MMVIRHLSSQVDFEAGASQHLMVVGLLEGGALEIPIDALTYGQLVGAFEQLHLQVQSEPSSIEQPYVEPVPTIEDVRQQVESHLGHQLAPGPIPAEEAAAEAQLRQLEQSQSGQDGDAEALLKSVGFFPDQPDVTGELDAMAASGVEDDEPDRGEGMYPEEEEDGVEAY